MLNKIEYFPVLIFLSLLCLVAFILLSLAYFLAPQKSDNEKLSAYECGFDPFQDARIKFEVHFYLIAILFIIFDLEIVFLFPWAVVISFLNFYGFISMFSFLLILGLGFWYEWHKGALEWS